MTRKQKKELILIGISLVFFTLGLLIPLIFSQNKSAGFISFLFLMTTYIIVGFDVLKEAIWGLFHGQLFDENFLMAIATVGALIIGEFHEAAAVMIFYQIGEWFQSYAIGKSRASIAALMDIRPETANVERNGTVITVDPEEVLPDEMIVIRAGERVPLDGVIAEGTSALDTSSLTGESLPREVSEGCEIISGCINLTGLLRVRVTKPYCDSTVARILELVENASDKKAKVESFITRFARVYTPAVCAVALLLAILSPLFWNDSWSVWTYRALSFLVVSCPCALVISVPLGFFGGIGAASRQGILVKGSNQLEALAKARIAVFDKTGTLTQGRFRVTEVKPVGTQAHILLYMAAIAESHSTHPISHSICEAAPADAAHEECTHIREIAGQGMQVVWKSQQLCVGNEKMMQSISITPTCTASAGTVVHVALKGAYMGCIIIADEVKNASAAAITALKKVGIQKTIMLSGDQQSAAASVASKLGIDEYHAQLLPQDKLTHLERILAQKSADHVLVYVGDGINDAPVLMRADVGVAMGALGSDAAVEAADVVLMDDDPRKLALAVRISRKTLAIVRQNIIFALGVKLLVLSLVAFGAAGMWLAVFADVGVSVIAILNAMRALQPEKEK